MSAWRDLPAGGGVSAWGCAQGCVCPGVCVPGDVCAQGLCLPRGVPDWGVPALGCLPHTPPVNRITDAFENIILPQLVADGKNRSI